MKEKVKQLKQGIKRIKENNFRSCLQELIVQMNGNGKQLVKISTGKGILNWLTMLPITEHGSEHQSSSSGIQFTIWLGNLKCFKVLSMWKQIRH